MASKYNFTFNEIFLQYFLLYIHISPKSFCVILYTESKRVKEVLGDLFKIFKKQQDWGISNNPFAWFSLCLMHTEFLLNPYYRMIELILFKLVMRRKFGLGSRYLGNGAGGGYVSLFRPGHWIPVFLILNSLLDWRNHFYKSTLICYPAAFAKSLISQLKLL